MNKMSTKGKAKVTKKMQKTNKPMAGKFGKKMSGKGKTMKGC